jgi:integral membrane sensor domain MASE1
LTTVTDVEVPIGTLRSSSALERHGDRTRLGALRFALQVLLLGIACHASTEFGFAHKLPPHGISALWPTIAILFSVLVAAPVRHWWAYIVAAYFTSVINDVRAGLPTAALLFVAAGVVEVLIAAVLVRRFADGVRAFQSLRCALIYILSAVIVAPAVAAFVAALAGGEQNYFFYWRVWFLSEALAYLMLAPAILAWFAAIRGPREAITLERAGEALLVFVVLSIVCALVFWLPTTTGNLPALVYLPLPLMLWATVRFGPVGLNSALLLVAIVSISGAEE